MARSPINSASTLINAAGGWRTMDEILKLCKDEKAQFVAMDEDGGVFTHCVNPFHGNQDHKLVMSTVSGVWDSDFGTVHMHIGKVPRELRGNWKTKCYSLEELLK